MKVVLLGDSIMLSLFNNATATILAPGSRTTTNLATSGHTSAQQLAVWLASAQRGDLTYDCACIHVGINDVQTAVAVATCLANVDSIRADMRTQNPNMRIVLSLMLPARTGASVAPRWFSHFIPIQAGFVAAASLYDSLVYGAYAALDQGDGTLNPTFDSSDHLHPTIAGNVLHAKYLRQCIDDAQGLLSCGDLDHPTRSGVGGWRDSLGFVAGNGPNLVPGHKCPVCP